MTPRWLPLLCASAVVIAAGPVAAGPFSEIASAFDPDDPFDLYVSVDYELDVRRSAVKRELAGLAGTDPGDPMPVVKDLVFEGTRHVLTPRLQLGIFTDVALTFALPVVISDERHLELDQRADPCVFPGDPGPPTCIDRSNSSTIADGILPSSGFDARDPTGPGFTSGATIFRGPKRSGLDQLHLGLAWALMNQRRDPTKPTWKIGGEVRFAVGKDARFNRAEPSRETGVGRGYHEVRLWTTMAKRTSWAEPFVEFWWQAPIKQSEGSAFTDPGFGATRVPPQQIAGTRFGFEAFLWEDPGERQSVTLELDALLQANFEGRNYTEMWEVFAYAGAAQFDGPLVLDRDPLQSGRQDMSHPGVSNVENYLTFAGRVGLRATLGERVQFGAGFRLRHDQSHLISFADAGIDLPTCRNGNTTGCEPDANDVVNPGTEEVNPLHVPLIDQVGHRYRVDDAFNYLLLIDTTVFF